MHVHRPRQMSAHSSNQRNPFSLHHSCYLHNTKSSSLPSTSQPLPIRLGHIGMITSLCQALANFGEDGSVLDVIFVICLELGCDTVQSALEGIFRRGVDHLWLYNYVISRHSS